MLVIDRVPPDASAHGFPYERINRVWQWLFSLEVLPRTSFLLCALDFPLNILILIKPLECIFSHSNHT